MLIIKLQVGELKEVLSGIDAQQVEEQLKVAERRFGDVERRLQRKLHLLQTTHQGSDSAQVDIAHIREWMAEKSGKIRDKEPVGFHARNAESKLQEVKVQKLKCLSFFFSLFNFFF